eukprot:5517028-Amphidinium_carterae.1
MTTSTGVAAVGGWISASCFSVAAHLKQLQTITMTATAGQLQLEWHDSFFVSKQAVQAASQIHCCDEDSPSHDGFILVLREVEAGVQQQLRLLIRHCEDRWLETVAQHPLCIAPSHTNPMTAAAVGVQHQHCHSLVGTFIQSEGGRQAHATAFQELLDGVEAE